MTLGTEEPHQEDSAEGSASSDNEMPSKDSNKLIEPAMQPEEIKTYGQLIRKVALALGLPIAEQRAQVEDVVFDVLHRDSSAPLSLPLSSVMLQAIQSRGKTLPWLQRQIRSLTICIGYRNPQLPSYTHTLSGIL